MSRVADYYRDSGVVRFLVIMTLYMAVVASLAFLLSSAVGWPFAHAFDVSFQSICGVSLLGGISWITISRLSAGQMLFDAGPLPQRRWYMAAAAFFLVSIPFNLDLSHILASLQSETTTLFLGAYFAVLATGRLQVHKKGLWLYTDLVPWRNIESYVLKDETFYFEISSWRFWMQRSFYTVPEAHIEAFERYLLEHNIPDNTAASLAPA